MKASLHAFLKSCLGATAGLILGLLVCKFAGESPVKILQVLFQSSFGSGYDFGMTLFYTAPFILTGLAVAIPFRAGLFNIGAEGQLTIGALCAAASGMIAPHLSSPVLAITFATLCAFIGGGLWGMIAGFLKAKRGSHEVITTIMLNFIAAGVSAYFVLYVMNDPTSSQPESVALPDAYILKPYAIFNGAPMGNLFWVLILLTVAIWFYLKQSRWGYQLKAMGENELAAETFGISRNRMWMSSMFVAGGLAGLVGVVEVLGNSHRFKIGFSADYGFVGIAVALVARGNVLGIIPAALLFGILQKGSGSLDLETDKITRDLSYIVEGLIILGVASDGLWDGIKNLRRKSRAQ
jgi:ABC-type uncharacterized transport system permease subunit